MTEHDPEWSRHHNTRAGSDFCDALWLDGYDHQSVWGYDTGVGSFFAQVWQNGSTWEEPELWVTPPDFWSSWPHALIPLIVDFTEHTPLDVVRAIGIARPAPELLADDDLADCQDRLRADAHEPYVDGQLCALDWVLGHSTRSPSSRFLEDHARPTAEAVDAEAAHATGVALLTGQSRSVGIEEALLSSLRT